MRKNLSPLVILWLCDLILFLSYTIGVPSFSFLKSSVLEYNNITSDPFDGAVSPIVYIPDWTKSKNTNKSLDFSSFAISDFMEIPEYDTTILSDDTQTRPQAILTRYTYPVVYMGSYRGNYTEYDGSHGAVDIRAPIGTPIVCVANGVVIKVKNVETGDGKYVIVRHDNVDMGNGAETLYSAYEHLSEITVTEGEKIKRGEILWKVGMTGITTTPHLHFQIDKASAPFHAFWPFTFREATNLGLDFFWAINVGLGKENVIRHTINPMEFIKNHRFLASAPPEKIVNIASTQAEQNTTTASSIQNPPETPVVVTEQKVVTSQDIVPITNTTTTPVTEKPIPEAVKNVPTFTPNIDQPFSDISKNSPFYTATKYLADAGVIIGYKDGGFHPNDLVSRSETVLLYARIFHLQPLNSATWEFIDILPTNEAYPYIARGLQDGIIAKNNRFRPNDSLTRAEAITLLVRTGRLPLDIGKYTAFQDVKMNNTHREYINTFASFLKLSGTNFYPSKSITRWELAKILYTFEQKRK